MIYLIGLGLDMKDLSVKALQALKKCKKVYLEVYTTKIPYKIQELEKIIGKKVILANRKKIENESKELIKESKKANIAILVYGDPLSATTHINFIREGKTEVIHSTSILTAVAQTGLSLYKFGKTTSLPRFQKGYKPDSFMKIIRENQGINAHTLLLINPGMTLKTALEQLEEVSKGKIGKIIILSMAGTKKQKILKGTLKVLKKKKIEEPFCIIIPSKLSYGEEI